jgi:hypothetical protein
MLEVLEFIFSSFWVWAGTLFLVAVAGNIGVSLVRALLRPLYRTATCRMSREFAEFMKAKTPKESN